ncbi:MAG: hypothetical protein ACXWX5_07730 [Actinomycetota bacterium]
MEVSVDRHDRAGAIAYWGLVVFLIVFGLLGLLSIGFPFLLLGITLAILSHRRHETGVIAAGVAAIVGFTVGYILVAPLGCTSSGGAPGSTSHTVCSNIVGIDYSGAGIYHPSLLPGLLVGILAAVAFALGARWVARRIAAGRASESPTVA